MSIERSTAVFHRATVAWRQARWNDRWSGSRLCWEIEIVEVTTTRYNSPAVEDTARESRVSLASGVSRWKWRATRKARRALKKLTGSVTIVVDSSESLAMRVKRLEDELLKEAA